jgi:hypothetical protein
MKKKFFLIVCAVLLIGLTPAIVSAIDGKPICLAGAPTVRTDNGITITMPNNNATTNACSDCVDKITITGLPGDAIVDGKVIISEVFSNATSGDNVCESSSPRYSYFPGTTTKFWLPDRNIISVVPLACTPGVATCTLTLDYPPVSGWHSPELHVDVQITIYRETNGTPGYQPWPPYNDVLLFSPANYGGTGGWDPYCVTTGCTPGYWKNHDFPSGVDPDAYVNTVFGITAVPGLTLIQALNQGGGGENALLRHAVAAYLDSMDPGTRSDWCWQKSFPAGCYTGGCAYCGASYRFTPAQVITLVQTAFAAEDFESIKNLFAAANETQCSIDDYPRWFGPCCTNLERFCSWWIANSVP